MFDPSDSTGASFQELVDQLYWPQEEVEEEAEEEEAAE